MAEAAGRRGSEAIAVPAANAPEAMLAGGARVVPLERLEQLASLGTEGEPPSAAGARLELERARAGGPRPLRPQRAAYLRYALEVAAAGGHSVLIIGPPGAGKSLAARRLPSILPPLEPRGGARGDADRERVRGARHGSTRRDAPVPRPASHDLDGRAGRRRLASSPGRGDAGPPRSAVPRRAGGVLARGARGASPAARGGAGDDRPRPPRGRASRAASCWSPPPTRAPAAAARNPGECECQPASAAPLPRQAERGARRPDRHRDLGRAPERRGHGAPPPARLGAASASASSPRESARSGGWGRPLQRRDDPRRAARACRLGPERASACSRRATRGSRLSGRGHDRVLRVSRTIADLDGAERVSDRARRAGAHAAAPRRRMSGAARRSGRSRGASRATRRRCSTCGDDAPATPASAAATRPGRRLDATATVTIVGSRRASSYGLRVAEELGTAAGRRRAGGSQRDGARDRRRRPPGGAGRRRVDDRGAGRRARRRLSARERRLYRRHP